MHSISWTPPWRPDQTRLRWNSERWTLNHEMIIARRFLVSGRVQGVGFRLFVQDHAAVEGAHGYVRNLADGRVEALVEGDDESVLRVERAIRRGPPGARIESVAVEDVPPTGRATGFAIR